MRLWHSLLWHFYSTTSFFVISQLQYFEQMRHAFLHTRAAYSQLSPQAVRKYDNNICQHMGLTNILQ